MCTRQPNFFMVGAPRAGTTSLYAYLRDHPQIFMSPVKEPNYFAQSLFTADYFRNRRKPLFDLERYLSGPMTEPVHFTYVTRRDDYVALFRNARTARVIGEASTFYLQCPDTPARIRDTLPDARILIILRDPVERAYSEYRMNLAIGFVRESFTAMLEREFIEGIKPGGLAAGSLYYEPVKRYLDTFGMDRLLILRHEQAVQQQLSHILCQFLDVTHCPAIERPKLNSAVFEPRSRFANFLLYQSGIKDRLSHFSPQPIKNLGKRLYYNHRQPSRPTADERTRVVGYFGSDIRALQDLLGWDLSSWIE